MQAMKDLSNGDSSSQSSLSEDFNQESTGLQDMSALEGLLSTLKKSYGQTQQSTRRASSPNQRNHDNMYGCRLLGDSKFQFFLGNMEADSTAKFEISFFSDALTIEERTG